MKNLSSNPPSTPMSLAAARTRLARRLEQVVADWQAAHDGPVGGDADSVTLFGIAGLYRLDGGRVVWRNHQWSKCHGNSRARGEQTEDLFIDTRFVDAVRATAAQHVTRLALDDLRASTGREDLGREPLRGLVYRINRLAWNMEAQGGWVSDAATKMRALLHPEAARLARRIAGHQATLVHHNAIAPDVDTWLLLEKDAPNLLPAIYAEVARGDMRLDANAFRALKETLRTRGFGNADWKFLARMPLTQMRYVLRHSGLEGAFQIVQHFARAGAVPPIEMLRSRMNRWLTPDRMFPAPPWFDAAAIAEFRRLKRERPADADAFFSRYAGDYRDALDWLRAWQADGHTPDTHQKQSGWQWIARQSAAWHGQQEQAQVLHQVAGQQRQRWTSQVPAYEDAGYLVQPLESTEDLIVEGRRMHHCVGTGWYDAQCAQGGSRIYSIRKSGQPVATVQLIQYGGRWIIGQNRGPCNSNPSAEVAEVASRLVKKYNDACRPHLSMPPAHRFAAGE